MIFKLAKKEMMHQINNIQSQDSGSYFIASIFSEFIMFQFPIQTKTAYNQVTLKSY